MATCACWEESAFPPLKTGQLRLYSMQFCPFAKRTRIVLEHKKIDYETVNIKLVSKPEWYLKDINPLGSVPALQHKDKIVYNSKICNEYLDEVHPDEKVIPSDPYTRDRDKMLMEHYTKITDVFYKGVGTGDWKEAAADFKKGLAKFEEEMENQNSPFFGGKNPMNIDFCIWPHLERVEAMKLMTSDFAITQEEFPRMHQWIQIIAEVPVVKKTVNSLEVHMKLWELSKASGFDFDFGLNE